MSLYRKDNWLHGWTGGEIPLNVDTLQSVIDNHYVFSKQQVQIYLNKHAFNISHWDKDLQDATHDISVNALFELAKMLSSDKYQEQGKIEPYLRTIIERKVIRYINYKIKHENRDDLEDLPLIDENEFLKEKRSLEEYIQDCTEDIRQSQVPHAINNLDLFYKQKFENKSIETLAEAEKTSIGGIKSRLRLIRKMLEDCIKNKANRALDF